MRGHSVVYFLREVKKVKNFVVNKRFGVDILVAEFLVYIASHFQHVYVVR